MGNFYTNYTLRGPSAEAVAVKLEGRVAVVIPERDGGVTVFDKESDTQRLEVIAALGRRLSSELQCSVLACLNHDDDVFWFQLFQNGVLDDEYNSSPDYFGGATKPRGPTGGDARKLCEVFGVSAVDAVEQALRGRFVFALERHRALVDALGITRIGVGAAFGSLCAGFLPEGVAAGDLIYVGVPENERGTRPPPMRKCRRCGKVREAAEKKRVPFNVPGSAPQMATIRACPHCGAVLSFSTDDPKALAHPAGIAEMNRILAIHRPQP